MAAVQQIIVKEFSTLNVEELLRVIRLREEVFCVEQKITEPEVDEVDSLCTYMWTECEGVITSFLRLVPAGVVYAQPSIGRVCTHIEFRGRGLSRLLMNAALCYIEQEWSSNEVKISAQAYLVDFYSSLGFKVVSDEYFEAGIRHYKMLFETKRQ